MRNFLKGMSPWTGIILAPVFLFFGWIGGIFSIIWAAIFFSGLFADFFIDSDEEAAQKRLERDRRKVDDRIKAEIARTEERKLIKEMIQNREIHKQEALIREQKIREDKKEKYTRLRTEIMTMPIHERWRQGVFNKCGNICQMCGSGSGLQVHHRDSFYLILKQNDIDSREKAFECKKLWDIDNGEVLCKECHDKMESSKSFIKNSINN